MQVKGLYSREICLKSSVTLKVPLIRVCDDQQLISFLYPGIKTGFLKFFFLNKNTISKTK